MGEACKPASGVTGRNGISVSTVAEEKLPAEYRGRIQGIHVACIA